MKKDEAKSAFEIGRSFINAGKVCESDECAGLSWSNPCLVPMIVNYAFAAEILLKVILTLKNIDYDKKHYLVDLFNQLSEMDQYEIKKVFAHMYSIEAESFDESLKSISNVFVYWRYIFENNLKPINLPFLCTFCDCLYDVSEKMIRDSHYD